MNEIAQAWAWLKANDLPHWVAVAFTAIVWPLALLWWQRRKKHGIPNLEVFLRPGAIVIVGKPHTAVELVFINQGL